MIIVIKKEDDILSLSIKQYYDRDGKYHNKRSYIGNCDVHVHNEVANVLAEILADKIKCL